MKTRIYRNYFSIDHLSQNEIRSAAGLDGRTDGPMAGNIPSSERVDTCVTLLFLYLYNISFLSALFLFIPLLSTRSTTTNMICMKGCYTQIMVGILYYTIRI